jgi:hypothetical protein
MNLKALTIFEALNNDRFSMCVPRNRDVDHLTPLGSLGTATIVAIVPGSYSPTATDIQREASVFKRLGKQPCTLQALSLSWVGPKAGSLRLERPRLDMSGRLSNTTTLCLP